MSEPRFDEIIHAPLRLRICAALAGVKALDFASLRALLGVADSVVSKHLAKLADAGYVVLDKVPADKHTRTWVRLTARGEAAFDGHVAYLKELVG